MRRDQYVAMTACVREPRLEDNFGPEFSYDYTYDEIRDTQGRRVNAVVDLGGGRLVPYFGYVDWYGDGGTQPGEVPMILLYEAMKLGAASAGE